MQGHVERPNEAILQSDREKTKSALRIHGVKVTVERAPVSKTFDFAAVHIDSICQRLLQMLFRKIR